MLFLSKINCCYHTIKFDKHVTLMTAKTFSVILSRADCVFDRDSGIEPLWQRHNTPVKELYCLPRLMKYVGEAEHKEEVTLLCCLARQKPSLYMWADKRTVIKTRPSFSGQPFWESPPKRLLGPECFRLRCGADEITQRQLIKWWVLSLPRGAAARSSSR